MDFLKLDRTAFKPQTISEAANHVDYYKKMTWQERLAITAFLNSAAFNFDPNNPPRISRVQFSTKSLLKHG
jgi:hypothetical protein